MPDYIDDPDLLGKLNGAEAPAGRTYIDDPALLRHLDGDATGKPAAGPTPQGPLGNEAQAFGDSALNTATFGLYRNALAAATAGLGKLGVPGYPDTGFADHYAKWKKYDEDVNRENPKSSIAGSVTGAGAAALAAPVVLPEASMAAMYGGGAQALARSATIGAGLSGGAVLADTHDLKKAGLAATAGAVAGPVADKAARLAAPLFRGADQLVPREVEAALGSVTVPGTAAWARNQAGNLATSAVGGAAGAAAGGAAGAAAGALLPGDYSHYAGGLGGAGLGGAAGLKAVSQYNAALDALKKDGKLYPTGNRGSAFVGSLIPQAMIGLLGDGN